MESLKSMQDLGNSRPALYSLSTLVRKAVLGDRELKDWLAPLAGDLDHHFAVRIEVECKQAPALAAARHLLSVYAEMKSCVMRVKNGMLVEAIPVQPKQPTNDFLVETDKGKFLVEVKTKFRPQEEAPRMLLERIIQSIRENHSIKHFDPPYHANYFTLKCNCNYLKSPLHEIGDAGIMLIKTSIAACCNQVPNSATFQIACCPNCAGDLCLIYTPSNKSAAAYVISNAPISPQSTLENLIVGILDKAKKQLDADPASRTLSKHVDLYICESNELMVDSTFTPSLQQSLENFARQEATVRGIHLDFFECPGWL
jgi:hypothetical protein